MSSNPLFDPRNLSGLNYEDLPPTPPIRVISTGEMEWVREGDLFVSVPKEPLKGQQEPKNLEK